VSEDDKSQAMTQSENQTGPLGQDRNEPESETKPTKIETSKDKQGVAATAERPPTSMVRQERHGSPLIALVLAMALIVFLGILYLVIFYNDKIPYLGNSLDESLNRTIRYHSEQLPEVTDWRENLQIEQTVWIDELSHLESGDPKAPSFKRKRDNLIYLADSFYKDEPRFEQARNTYIEVLVEPRVEHENEVNLHPAELLRRIGYCSLRLGDLDTAISYLTKALDKLEQERKSSGKIKEPGIYNWSRDNLAEAYIRKNNLTEGQKIIDARLKDIELTSPDTCIEPHLVVNVALAKEKEGKLPESVKYFEQALACLETENKNRGVIKGSLNDNDRNLARILKEYSRILRKAGRNPEAWSAMDRAVTILDNSP
jgi:tetratricopeptide (TPR) repeat protein